MQEDNKNIKKTEEEKQDKNKEKKEKSRLQDLIEWIICIVVAIVLALVVKYYIGTPTMVQQKSMFPTLHPYERLWITRWERTIKKLPQRGDIITFEAPSTTFVLPEDVDLNNPVATYKNNPENIFERFSYYALENEKTSYIKRVIALPGEYVEIKEGAVYIDGTKLEENYLQPGMVTDMINSNGISSSFTNFTVPENYVFAMGDNRTGSIDCRSFGCIPLEKIEGKVLFRFWPLTKLGGVD